MFRSRWLARRPRAGLVVAAGTALLLTGIPASAEAAQGHSAEPVRPAGDGPAGFWYGTDSLPIAMKTTTPYQTPVIGGYYGGYIGMAGNWAYREGCHGKIVFSQTNHADANANFNNGNIGIGTGVYWFMGGPGVDPHYNGSTAEASSWGAEQAQWTLGDIPALGVTYPVVFMDVELPGIAPAVDNGWNDVYTSPCSGKVKASFIPATVDRAEINGYAAYLTSHSSYKAGIYSNPSVWTDIFGTEIGRAHV